MRSPSTPSTQQLAVIRMISLKDKLLLAEEDFLSALSGGEKALLAFEDRWQSLMEDVEAAAASQEFDLDTSSLIHTTALRIATLADTSVALFTSYDTLTAELVGELDSMLSELSLSDHTPSRLEHPQFLSTSSPSAAAVSSNDAQLSNPCLERSRKRRRDNSEHSDMGSRLASKRWYVLLRSCFPMQRS